MIPHVVYAKYVKDYKIFLIFQDGEHGEIDLKKFLTGPVFEPLKNKKTFSNFCIDGFTLNWNDRADIAPETLYKEVMERKY
jgi:hypothetical protein